MFKIHWSISLGMDLRLKHDFVTSCIGCLENIDLLRDAGIPNVELFYETMLKRTTIVNITKIIVRKVLTLGELASSWWQIQVFQKFNFYSKAQTLPLSTNNDNSFSLVLLWNKIINETGLFHLFLTSSPSLNAQSEFVCWSLLQVKTLLVQLNSDNPIVLFLSSITMCRYVEVHLVYFLFFHIEY